MLFSPADESAQCFLMWGNNLHNKAQMNNIKSVMAIFYSSIATVNG